jgi:hypothetical protein
MIEKEAWTRGFEFAGTHDISFSSAAIKWAETQAETYKAFT